MGYIKITDVKAYLPKEKILNEKIEKRFNLEEGYIKKRTGIEQRYYVKDETIEEMAIKAVEKISKTNDILEVDLIIVATTSTNKIMPGISNYIKKFFNIKPCICLDVLAGCSGFINALDICKVYIECGKVKKALIVGVDLLSKIVDENDLSTVALLSDGAGAMLIESCKEKKKYFSNIKAEEDQKDILTYEIGKNKGKIYMNGKEVYKYAVTNTVENIKEILLKSVENIENIKYIIPHQSNMKIMKAIANRLDININKLYINIENVGNTFCASIPIAMAEMKEKDLLQENDKIILLGYGGGLNTGSILLEY